MTFDFKSNTEELSSFRRRIYFAFAMVALCFMVLLGRFAWLQIIHRSDYQERAERNRIVSVTSQGSRGLIFDRNGTLMAGNVWAYTLEIIPEKTQGVKKTIEALSSVLSITEADKRRFRRLQENLNRYSSIPIRSNLTPEEVAVFVAQKNRFPGVEINQREYRTYPLGESGSHIIGYIGSISPSDRRRLDREGTLSLYEGAREIGKVGIERSYEPALHGVPGHESLEVTASGRAVRSLDLQVSRPGSNLTLTVDMNLQRVAEEAMKDKTGALIAIEPKTGAILAFASLPTYNINLFPGGIDPDSWNQLNTSEQKPLLNRAMRGIYPIGSTYKPFMALAGLENRATTIDYVMNDTGTFTIGNHKFRDMSGVPKGPLSIRKSIAVSSDVYYYWLATQLGVDRIYEFMKPWGFGQKTGIDLVGEQTGVLPSRAWKEKRFKKPWVLGDTPSLGIGQGYNAFTLLQLAHATATLANRGVVMTPHLVESVTDPVTGQKTYVAREPAGKIPLKTENLNAVISGMIDVTQTGTARAVFKGAPYTTAGKTGTAQVITIAQEEKYDARKIARRYQDHALFIAFAPARNPKIALAVLVENGGFGARAAAPVARAVMDYWLTGENDLGLPPPKSAIYRSDARRGRSSPSRRGDR